MRSRGRSGESGEDRAAPKEEKKGREKLTGYSLVGENLTLEFDIWGDLEGVSEHAACGDQRR